MHFKFLPYVLHNTMQKHNFQRAVKNGQVDNLVTARNQLRN